MRSLFVSYARGDREAVQSLAGDLGSLDYDVWYDDKLTGGQSWWDELLLKIQHCDVYALAVSPDSLQSQACRLERAYAMALDKNIVPILIADDVNMDLLPPDLARIQLVDYRLADKQALVRLLRTLTRLPDPRPLPSPLPPPPAIPLSYLSGLRMRIEAEQLPPEQQAELVLTLKRGMKDAKTRDNAVVLLRQLRGRRDLLAWISDEIDELLEGALPAIDNAPSDTRAARPVVVSDERGSGAVLPRDVAALQRAAEAGDVNAQLGLAQMYADGVNGAADYATAAKWNLRAAKSGNREAQYHLAVLYSFGRGVEQDRALAFEWFRKAAEKGHAGAQFNLGLRYAQGDGVGRDETEALRWFQKAAQQGHAKAREEMKKRKK